MDDLSAPAQRAPLRERIRSLLLEEPRSFYDIVRLLDGESYAAVLRAWGDLRTEVALVSGPNGRYRLAGPAGGPPVGDIGQAVDRKGG